MCKIGSNPRFRISFSIAGTVADNRTFSSIDLAESAISSATDIRATATKFVASAVPSFKQTMQRMRREDRTEYNKNLRAPEPFQIVFADFENNEPTFVVIAFKLTESNTRITTTPSQDWCPGPACPNGTAVMALGENGAIRSAAANSAFFTGLNPQTTAIKLVQTEINASPSIVGPPISDLTIDAEGAHWGNKGECQ